MPGQIRNEFYMNFTITWSIILHSFCMIDNSNGYDIQEDFIL